MKIRGVLLATKEEQIAGGDKFPIDPKLIKLEQEVPVDLKFDRTKTVGRTTRVWLEDGRILFEAEVDPDPHASGTNQLKTAAIGYMLESYDAQKNLIKGGRLFAVGLTDQNENRNQPPWEVIEDGESTNQ